MSDPISAKLADFEKRIKELEGRESPEYSTGTYTPTYVGGTTAGVTTYSTQQGVYTRIGNIVMATGAVAWTNATGTGNARISLPFTAQAGVNHTGALRLVNVTFANGSVEPEFAGVNYFEMRSPATNAGGTVVAVEVAGNIIFTIVFLI